MKSVHAEPLSAHRAFAEAAYEAEGASFSARAALASLAIFFIARGGLAVLRGEFMFEFVQPLCKWYQNEESQA